MKLLKSLLESDGYQQFADVWTTAVTHLEDKARQLVSLPETSPEKLLSQALLGAFYKHKPDSDSDVGSKLEALSSDLSQLVGHNDGELAQYIHSTIEGLRRLIIQLPADEENLVSPVKNEVGDEPEEEIDPQAEKPKEDSEGEQSEQDKLALELGLKDSVSRVRLINLLEDGTKLGPGQTVTFVRNGKVFRRQILKVNGNRVRIVNPDNPAENEEVDSNTLGVEDKLP